MRLFIEELEKRRSYSALLLAVSDTQVAKEKEVKDVKEKVDEKKDEKDLEQKFVIPHGRYEGYSPFDMDDLHRPLIKHE